ncbi:hypothetical protein [Pseudomonas violetae]|uniref:Apea-like HEPN domain-containing protein n=1 Tax=Pseudomonas violetae TaxID=2915813 RepID=A0ABT0EZJ8_9PSED|nr:hypothetical protein [Pseudomonas violetae]MCK1791176.1 hypothetical protein [Pseudomonas violetae]
MDRLDFKSNWPINDEHLLELGRLMTMWIALENQVMVSISKLMGYDDILDRRPTILLAHANFKQRVDALHTLCEQLVKQFPSLANYENVISKIKAAQKGRNKYAHNGLTLNPESGHFEIHRLSAQGTLKVTSEIVHVNDIREVTAKTHEAACLLYTLITSKPCPTMWERQSPRSKS